ncbi:PREDICTED: uncharacterized protein LOC108538115 [Rhinopithecus bieti]|uniref:uncharacterized protein LOC108538115 n=1 Tax=Rhinopithecus bieti TaxID=61621 RepID=UPI00083C4FE7|nr:PREDICTED: uncharacterized protein LOC108538115 [Rhinopithecus bieti]
MARLLRGSGAPGTQRVQNRERRSHPWRSAAALGAKVRAQLGRGQSPLSSPEAVAKPRVLESNLVALAHSRAAPPPWLLVWGSRQTSPPPGGYLRTPPSPRPALRSPDAQRAARDAAEEQWLVPRSRPAPCLPLRGARLHRSQTVLSVGAGSGAPSGPARCAPTQGPREGVLTTGGRLEPIPQRPAQPWARGGSGRKPGLLLSNPLGFRNQGLDNSASSETAAMWAPRMVWRTAVPAPPCVPTNLTPLTSPDKYHKFSGRTTINRMGGADLVLRTSPCQGPVDHLPSCLGDCPGEELAALSLKSEEEEPGNAQPSDLRAALPPR